MLTRSLETERKYDLAADKEVPDLVGGRVAASSRPTTSELRATYYDTEGFALAAAGVTLRRRTGGQDDGWHVKLSHDIDSRREIGHPLGRGTQVPAVLARMLTTVTLGAPLVHVVELHTVRVARTLTDADGAPLAELADDTVSAQRFEPTGLTQVWRELEVELCGTDTHLLDELDQRLSDAGVSRSNSASKLRRALDDAVAMPAEQPEHPTGLPRKSAGALLHRYLADQRDALAAADLAVRVDDAPVHDVRVAARRLRAALTVYRPLLDEALARHLQAELKWLGQELSAVRDLEVVGRLLIEALENDEADPQEVATREFVRKRLGSAGRPATASAQAAMKSQRYVALLADLNAFLGATPWTPLAEQRGDKVMPSAVGKSLRHLRKSVDAVPGPGSADRSDGLHEVRKAAKRLRYALEAAEPAVGGSARRLGKKTKQVQTTLGDYLDAHHVRDCIRRIGHDRGAGAAAFALGGLHAEHARRVSAMERDNDRTVRKLLKSGDTKAFKG